MPVQDARYIRVVPSMEHSISTMLTKLSFREQIDVLKEQMDLLNAPN